MSGGCSRNIPLVVYVVLNAGFCSELIIIRESGCMVVVCHIRESRKVRGTCRIIAERPYAEMGNTAVSALNQLGIRCNVGVHAEVRIVRKEVT